MAGGSASEARNEQGGDPACWAHLFAEGDDPSRVVVDLGAVADDDEGGGVWKLPHGGDLDATLVRLTPEAVPDEHVEHELDVLVVVLVGAGQLVLDTEVRPLRRDVLALIPRGARRRIDPGPTGLVYLSVHRRRDPRTDPARRRPDRLRPYSEVDDGQDPVSG